MGLGSTWDDEWTDLRVVLQNKNVHRLSMKGKRIWYTAVVFEKVGSVREGGTDCRDCSEYKVLQNREFLQHR